MRPAASQVTGLAGRVSVDKFALRMSPAAAFSHAGDKHRLLTGVVIDHQRP